MKKADKYILTTRPIAKILVDDAAAKNITIEELSFIETRPIKDLDTMEKIKSLSTQFHTIIFTSMNAVEAVADLVNKNVAWNIYCMGNTTKALIEEKFPSAKIIGTADNAEALAERILDDDVKTLVFFCGNIRREELPKKLRSNAIELNEVVVYETIEIQNTISKEYDGILFFSPSAVESFFKFNKIQQSTKLFAIGKTTKETIRKYADNKIILAQTANKNKLASQAVTFFMGE